MIPPELKEQVDALSDDELTQAESELQALAQVGRMHLSKHPLIYKMQVKMFALGLRTKQERPQASTNISDSTGVVRHERAVACELVGPNSIYAQVSYSDRQTRRTQVLAYLFDSFHSGGKSNTLILGGVGSGKTYGTIAYVCRNARLWHHRGVPVIDALFVRAYSIGELIQRKSWERLEEIRNKKWLIVDDLGIEGAGYKGTDFHAFFEDLFIQRHEQKKRTLMTSNATLEQVKETFGERFLSRLRETGEIFQTNDPDMRRLNEYTF